MPTPQISSPFLDLRRMDCMELMAQYPDKHFELAIVDPPYGIGEDGKSNHSRNQICQSTKFTPKAWDKNPPAVEYFEELKRVSRHQIIWGANHMMDRISKASTSWIVWDKVNYGSDFADAELAFTSHAKAVRIFKFQWNGMMQGDMKNKEQRVHPTQKPVALYNWLLENYAKPGGKILDTHMGSGSIAIACHYRQHHLTACELDEDYFRDACNRIEKETRQLTFI